MQVSQASGTSRQASGLVDQWTDGQNPTHAHANTKLAESHLKQGGERDGAAFALARSLVFEAGDGAIQHANEVIEDQQLALQPLRWQRAVNGQELKLVKLFKNKWGKQGREKGQAEGSALR